MEQNNNIEEFDSNAQTAVFNPVNDEKPKEKQPVQKPVRDIYEIEELPEKDDNEKSSDINGILLSVVIVLVILFIAAIIWGTFVLNKMNKKEEIPSAPVEVEEVIPEEVVPEEPEEEVIQEKEEKERKVKCTILFKPESVEEEEYGYTVRAIYKDGKGKYYTERLTVDSETKIKEDRDSLSYKSFINNVIENIGNREVEFDAIVNTETNHVDSISYDSKILEPEEEGIIIEEVPEEEKNEEIVIDEEVE